MTEKKKKCLKGKILNPKTNHCVDINGKVGRTILAERAEGKKKSTNEKKVDNPIPNVPKGKIYPVPTLPDVIAVLLKYVKLDYNSKFSIVDNDNEYLIRALHGNRLKLTSFDKTKKVTENFFNNTEDITSFINQNIKTQRNTKVLLMNELFNTYPLRLY